MVKQWSRDRDEKKLNAILFINEPNITLSKWTKSYQFAKSPKIILEYTSKATNETDYYVPAGATEKLPRSNPPAGRTRPVKSRIRYSKRQTYDRKRAVFYPFIIDSITAVSCRAVYGPIQL